MLETRMQFRTHRRAFVRHIVRWLCVTALAVGGLAHAQVWPSRPVRMVVPVGSGGTADTLARVVGQALQRATGQPFVVDLKPGAAGAIASMDVMRQPPDGYTLLLATATTHGVVPAVTPNVGYSLADFTAVGLLAETNVYLLISPKHGVKNVKELIELARAKPGFINYMSNGSGSFTHLVSELLALNAGLKMTHIPYRGFAQVLPDLMSGTIHIAWDSVPSSLPYVKDGRLIALAVSGSKRTAATPDIPTIGEALSEMGIPGFAASAWFSLFGSRGMPPELTRRINEEVNKALRSPEVEARFAAMGLEPTQSTPAELDALAKRNLESWRRVAREANIKVE